MPGEYVMSRYILTQNREVMCRIIAYNCYRITRNYTVIFVWFLQSRTFEQLCKRFVGQASVPRDSLLNLDIPVPPLSEQKRIVKKVEELFNDVDKIKKYLDETIKRANVIDQSILVKAFQGELVPQDPNDEPASVLLERIRTSGSP